MALIEWQEKFRIGVPAVDYEHQELIGLLNELYEGLGSGAGQEDTAAFLGEVYARISAHFALEEKVMRERGYDEFIQHKGEHEMLLDDIREIMDSYEEGVFEGSLEQLGRRLETWFAEHFRTRDARLHKLLPDDNIRLGEI